MRNRPALLKTSAAIAWGTALGTGFDGLNSKLDGRVFMLSALIGTILTLTALVEANVTRRIDAMFLAIHRAEITRPDGQDPPTGPFPVIELETYRANGNSANRG